MRQFSSNKQALRCMAMVALGHGLGIKNPEHISPQVTAMLAQGIGTSSHCGLVAFGFNTNVRIGRGFDYRSVPTDAPSIEETWLDALEMTESEFCRKWVSVDNANSYQQIASRSLRAFKG